MGLWQRFLAWKIQRRIRREDLRVERALRQLAADYETFPRMFPIKNKGWLLMASRYRSVVSTTPTRAIAEFRRVNTPNYHP